MFSKYLKKALLLEKNSGAIRGVLICAAFIDMLFLSYPQWSASSFSFLSQQEKGDYDFALCNYTESEVTEIK